MFMKVIPMIKKKNFSLSSFNGKRFVVSNMNFERKNFHVVNDSDIAYFNSVLKSPAIINKSDMEPYNKDWLSTYKGNSSIVLRPQSTEEVSQVLKYCNENKIAVVPQGGNTGLVGGSVPVFDEVIINMGLMNKIEYLDVVNGTMICEAGCVLEQLSNYLDERGCMMPLDLGAKGSCQIGGNLSTAAGGLRFLRYRSLHANTLGLEIVLPNGEILSNLKTIKKDNTGYHLDHLFIGSEGSLGIITKACIQVPPKPLTNYVVLFGVHSFQQCIEIYRLSRSNLSSIMSAFEYFDNACLNLVLDTNLDARNPLDEQYPYYVLVEVQGFDNDHDQLKILEFSEMLQENSLVADATFANDMTKVKQLWMLRETITTGLTKAGATYKYDISIPLQHMDKMVINFRKEMIQRKLPIEVLGYGHMGDENLQ